MSGSAKAIFVFVIAREGVEPVLGELLAHLQRDRPPRQKYPERLAVVREFPRTASGKVGKELRALAAQIVAAA